MPPPEQPTPWEVLGIAEGADFNTIRSAYQDLILQYHPDKVINAGPELRSLAEKRTQNINKAYSWLRERHRTG